MYARLVIEHLPKRMKAPEANARTQRHDPLPNSRVNERPQRQLLEDELVERIAQSESMTSETSCSNDIS